MRCPSLLSALLVAAGLPACGGEDSVATADDAEIVAKLLANTAVVHEDRLVFPRASLSPDLRGRIDRFAGAMSAGKSKEEIENVLLVADREDHAADDSGQVYEDAGNPFGFIRRALSYEDAGSETVVMTEPATMAEVFSELEQNGMVEIGAEPESPTGSKSQAEGSWKLPTIPIVDLSGMEVFREGDTVVRLASAYVKLDTTFDVGVDIGFFRVKEAHLIVTADVSSELVVEGESTGLFEKSFSQMVYEERFKLSKLGPAPMTLGVQVHVACDMVADGDFYAMAGAHADVTLRGGVAYTKSEGFHTVKEPPVFVPALIGPELVADGVATVRCELIPFVEVFVFDRPAARITPVIVGQLDVVSPPPEITVMGGLSVHMQGELSVFGKDLGVVDEQLADVEKQLWSGSL